MIRSLVLLAALLASTVLHAQWSRTDGPAGAAVDRIIADDNALIATVGNMFYRSSDSGESWIRMSWMPWIQPDDMAAMPGALLIGAGGSVLRSTDHGDTWSEVLTGDSLGTISLTVSPRGYLFARSATGGLWGSEDRGETWVPLGDRFDGVTAGRIVDHHAMLYIPVPGVGLFRSANDGVDWEPVLSPSTRPGVLQSFNDTLFLGTMGEGVFLSPNDGTTWIPASDGSGSPAGNLTQIVAAGNDLYALEEGEGVVQWRSGRWRAIETSSRPMTIASDNADLLIGDRFDAIFRLSDRGERVRRIDNGIHSHYQVNAIVGSASGLVAGTDNGVLRSDDGLQWRRPDTDTVAGRPVLTRSVLALVEYDGRLYAALARGVVSSSDGGRTWDALQGEIATARVVTGFLIHDGMLLACSFDRIFRIDPVRQRGERLAESPTRVVTILQKGGVLYAGTDGAGVYRSSTAGATWSRIDIGLGSPEISRLAIVAGRIFASSLHDTWEWIESSGRWQPYGFGVLDGGAFLDVAQMPGAPGVVLAAIAYIDSATGAFRQTILCTIDSGESWKIVTDPESEGAFFRTLHLTQQWLLAGTMGTGIWKISIEDLLQIAAIEKPRLLPGGMQILPNPSAGRTELLLRLESARVIDVEIFDLLGRPLRLLHGGYLGAGEHRFAITGLDAGTYLVRAGEIVEPLIILL